MWNIHTRLKMGSEVGRSARSLSFVGVSKVSERWATHGVLRALDFIQRWGGAVLIRDTTMGFLCDVSLGLREFCLQTAEWEIS